MELFARAAEAGRTLRADLRVIAQQFGRQDIFFHAGSVAYSALLAAVPFLLLLASALGFIVGRAPAASDAAIESFLNALLPGESAAAAVPIVRSVLLDVEDKAAALGLLGAPLFAWFSTQFFGSLRASLSSVFNVERGHSFFRGKLFDMLYVMVGTVLVTIYLALNAYLSLATNAGGIAGRALGLEPHFMGYARILAGPVFAAVFVAVMFTGLYKFLPTRRVPWKSALWGGVWGTLLFEITRTVIFQLASRAMRPASVYTGTLAAIVVIVFWAYYAAVIFLIGGVVARVHEVRDHRRKSVPQAAQ